MLEARFIRDVDCGSPWVVECLVAGRWDEDLSIWLEG